MKKRKTLFMPKKFHRDPQKQYKKKLRIYPPFLYRLLDKWLKKMSSKGWHVVHCNMLFFWFEKGEAKELEYFTYGLHTQEGKYSLVLRHPFIEETYGVKKKKSKINSNETKAYQIVEIDLQKAEQKNIGYKELVNDRNRLYFLYFLRNFIVISLVAAFVIIISLF